MLSSTTGRIAALLIVGLVAACEKAPAPETGSASPAGTGAPATTSASQATPSIGASARQVPAPDLVLTSSDLTVLPFDGAGFRGGLNKLGRMWQLALGGPFDPAAGLRQVLPWRLVVALPVMDDNGKVSIARPEDLQSTSNLRTRPGQAVAYLSETSTPGAVNPPAFWAVGGSLTVSGFEATDRPNSMVDNYRFDVAIDLEVQRVDRSGPTPTLSGPKVRLNGTMRIDTGS